MITKRNLVLLTGLQAYTCGSMLLQFIGEEADTTTTSSRPHQTVKVHLPREKVALVTQHCSKDIMAISNQPDLSVGMLF